MRDDSSTETELIPVAGTIERWAWNYVLSADLAFKLTLPNFPLDASGRLAWEASPSPRRALRPGRPPEFELVERAPRPRRPGALMHAHRRAELIHAFFHHELQAAELLCWAFLAFPDAPRPFRAGLLRICRDEIRHMHLYREQLHRLGSHVGAYPVRDWFWVRLPQVVTPAEFVAALGIGFEGGNLDHARRYAERFRKFDDHEAAAVQDLVCAEEIGHVRFAVHWFRRFTGGLDFTDWLQALPPRLSPVLLRGKTMNRRDRRRAGLNDDFLDRLAACSASDERRGSKRPQSAPASPPDPARST